MILLVYKQAVRLRPFIWWFEFTEETNGSNGHKGSADIIITSECYINQSMTTKLLVFLWSFEWQQMSVQQSRPLIKKNTFHLSNTNHQHSSFALILIHCPQ